MAGDVSRENGKKGGRKVGSKAAHTLEAQELKKRLIKCFKKDADKIYGALIEKAKTGDVQAIKELLDRVWGKAPQQIDTPGIEEALKIIFDDSFKKNG